MTKQRDLLPFHIIAAASNGDVDAINAVLKHYEGYIASLSLRRVYEVIRLWMRKYGAD